MTAQAYRAPSEFPRLAVLTGWAPCGATLMICMDDQQRIGLFVLYTEWGPDERHTTECRMNYQRLLPEWTYVRMQCGCGGDHVIRLSKADTVACRLVA